jgi:hypothetical protein
MSPRSFIDREGVRWRVSEVIPESSADRRERRAEARPQPRGKLKKARFTTRPVAIAWLCFESRSSRRQLTPVPEGWTSMTDTELEDLMADSRAIAT